MTQCHVIFCNLKIQEKENFKRFLINKNHEIIYLENDSTDKIRTKIEDLSRRIEEKENFLLYFYIFSYSFDYEEPQSCSQSNAQSCHPNVNVIGIINFLAKSNFTSLKYLCLFQVES